MIMEMHKPTKEKRNKMKNYVEHLIHKTMDMQIEWWRMLEWLAPNEGERILDIAYGVELSLKIAERGCDVSGIDMPEGGVERAKRLAERERVACKFVVGSARGSAVSRRILR